jgi:hypothetical protein
MCGLRGASSVRRGASCVALAIAAIVSVSAASKRESELLKQKVAQINAHAEKPTQQSHRTIVTEGEVNSYLTYDAGDQIPKGVVEPSVAILGAGKLSARAVVDLDAVRKAKNATSFFDPMSYLTGRLPVTAAGTLKTGNGTGQFFLDSASVAGVPIPKLVLQEIVSYYSRTPNNPSGIGLDDPFALPSRIREIQVERGQAIIIQ